MTIKYGWKHVLCNDLVVQWLVSSGDRDSTHSANLFLSLRFQKPHTLAPLVIWTHGTTGGFSISHPFQSIGSGSFRVWQDGVYYQPFTEQSRIIFHTRPSQIHYCYGVWQDGFQPMKERGSSFMKAFPTQIN